MNGRVRYVFETTLIAHLWEEAADLWVAHVPALNLYSQGTTLEEAKEAVKDAAGFYLKHCHLRERIGE